MLRLTCLSFASIFESEISCLSFFSDSEEALSDAFKKACSQSMGIWRARVAVIGTYRVGKTSVIHNLLGLPFVDQYVSTQGIHTQMAQTDKVLDVREVSEWNQIKERFL